jgi:transposase InsO family protein
MWYSRLVLGRIYDEFGLLLQIHMDNGASFGNVNSSERLTHLASWFLELGIELVYSDPGHPEQFGRHERVHRELKAGAIKSPSYGFSVQQRNLDEFREDYDELRPYHALGNLLPVRIHVPSSRRSAYQIPSWDYPYDVEVLKVC